MSDAERAHLDARWLLCPMPVIRTEERIKELVSGTELEVRTSDPGALHDIPAWCRVNGHEVLDSGEDDAEQWILVRVGAEP